MCAIYSLLINLYSLAEGRAIKHFRNVLGFVDIFAVAACAVDAACLSVMTVTVTYVTVCFARKLVHLADQSPGFN